MTSTTHIAPRTGIYFALGAAVLFGCSTPLAKSLLQNIDPQLLAGLLYAGAGIGLAVKRQFTKSTVEKSVSLRWNDLRWLILAIIAGGIAGPLLLMFGLRLTPASNTSLLLNLESVFTTLLAWFLFREHFDRRIVMGMMAILAGSLMLSWSGSLEFEGYTGALLIAGACLAWGIDNNVTRQISGNDPQQITIWKGITAGACNLGIGFALGGSLPAWRFVIIALIIGWLGYGISLQLFVLALRHIGTARTGAYFGIAPFVGVMVSLLFFRDEFTWRLLPATFLMAVGVWLHLSEQHAHEHHHEAIEHEHEHTHDDHHRHDHEFQWQPDAKHSHWHQHEPLIHLHPHYPDLHHRHEH